MSFLIRCGTEKHNFAAPTFPKSAYTPVVADLSGFDRQGKLPSSARLVDRQAGSGNRMLGGLGLVETKRIFRVWRLYRRLKCPH